MTAALFQKKRKHDRGQIINHFFEYCELSIDKGERGRILAVG
jgi:hypothetical protein